MKNAAGHPAQPSAPTLTPLYMATSGWKVHSQYAFCLQALNINNDFGFAKQKMFQLQREIKFYIDIKYFSKITTHMFKSHTT